MLQHPKPGTIAQSRLRGSAGYFNTVSSDYFNRYEEHSPGGYAFRIRKHRLLELLDGAAGRVLDVGCGPGVMVSDLISRGFDFWGVDAAPNMIAECEKSFAHLSDAHFCIGDASDLAFPPQSFDIVICAGVIDHVDHCERAIGEMLRVLKNDGILLLVFPNFYSPAGWWRNYVFYRVARLMRRGYYRFLRGPEPPALASIATLYSQRAATAMTERQGGRVESVTYYNFNQVFSPLDELFPKFTVWITGRLERLYKGSLKWLGSGFIVKAVKR